MFIQNNKYKNFPAVSIEEIGGLSCALKKHNDKESNKKLKQQDIEMFVKW